MLKFVAFRCHCEQRQEHQNLSDALSQIWSNHCNEWETIAHSLYMQLPQHLHAF